MITLQRLDHLVLTVADIESTCRFYSQVLGCEIIRFGGDGEKSRYALRLGDSPQKINLHPAASPFKPAAQTPQSGSADLCFITQTPLSEVLNHLHRAEIPVIEGPVPRTGTLGAISSIYIRDPDGNLIEIANEC